MQVAIISTDNVASVTLRQLPVRGDVTFTATTGSKLARKPETADVAVIQSQFWDLQTRALARRLKGMRMPFLLVVADLDPQVRSQALSEGALQVLGRQQTAELTALLSTLAWWASRDPERFMLANGFEVDLRQSTVIRDGRLLRLTSAECSILAVLAEAARARLPGSLTGRQISLAVRRSGRLCRPSTVRVHVHNLRGKVERTPDVPDVLVSDRHAGYHLVLQAEKSLATAGPDAPARPRGMAGRHHAPPQDPALA